jgi:hypothetical protein
MSHKVIEEFFRRIWVEGEERAIEAMFAPAARAHGILPDQMVGPEEFHVLVPAFRTLVRDINVSVVNSVTSGEWVSSLVRFTCFSTTNDRQAEITGQVMARIEGGRVAEAYNHFDFIPFFEMLDLLPPDTLSLCMAGQRIA